MIKKTTEVSVTNELAGPTASDDAVPNCPNMAIDDEPFVRGAGVPCKYSVRVWAERKKEQEWEMKFKGKWSEIKEDAVNLLTTVKEREKRFEGRGREIKEDAVDFLKRARERIKRVETKVRMGKGRREEEESDGQPLLEKKG